MHPTILSADMDKIVGQIGFFNLVMSTDLGEGEILNSRWLNSTKKWTPCRNIFCAEGLGKFKHIHTRARTHIHTHTHTYIYIYIYIYTYIYIYIYISFSSHFDSTEHNQSQRVLSLTLIASVMYHTYCKLVRTTKILQNF